MRFPSIPNVAKSIRLLSAAVPAASPVQLIVSKAGEWEVVLGHARIQGVHDHCYVGQGTVPGQNRKGRPHRFDSPAVARALIAQARAESLGLGLATRQPSQESLESTLRQAAVDSFAAASVQTRQAARGGPRTASGTIPPPWVPQPSGPAVDELVAFRGVTGRVVGQTRISTPTGLMPVHLVQVSPVHVPSWGFAIGTVVVASDELQPWTPPPQTHPGRGYSPALGALA